MDCNWVKKGYDLFLQACEKDPEYVTNGDDVGKRFFIKAKALVESQDESIFDIPFLTNDLDQWAASGAAGVAQPNFITFIESNETKDKIKQLIDIRMSSLSGRELIEAIDQVDFLKYMYSFMEDLSGSRPILYTTRLYTIMFPTITTTIADEKKLKIVAEAHDISHIDSRSYMTLQTLVRQKSSHCLREMGVYDDLSLFSKCVIPWHTLEAYKSKDLW